MYERSDKGRYRDEPDLDSDDKVLNDRIFKLPEESFVSKKQVDITAVYLYILGCSLMHFSLFVAMLFVKWPDVDRAAQVDEDFKFIYKDKLKDISKSQLPILSMCKDSANELENAMDTLFYLHIVGFFVNVYKEVFEKQYLKLGVTFKILVIGMTFV